MSTAVAFSWLLGVASGCTDEEDMSPQHGAAGDEATTVGGDSASSPGGEASVAGAGPGGAPSGAGQVGSGIDAGGPAVGGAAGQAGELGGAGGQAGAAAFVEEAQAIIDPAGTTIETPSVSLQIPSGAVGAAVAETLRVYWEGDDLIVELEPGIDFAVRALVSISPTLWTDTGSATVFRELDNGEVDDIDDLEWDPATQHWTYRTPGFSNNRVTRVHAPKPGQTIFKVGNRWPVDAETAVEASGPQPYRVPKTRDDGPEWRTWASGRVDQVRSCLVDLREDAYGFECFGSVSPNQAIRKSDEKWLAAPSAATALVTLQTLLNEHVGGSCYSVVVNGAFSSTSPPHKTNALHRWGAAVDLSVGLAESCEKVERLEACPESNLSLDEDALGVLAYLASKAGFTWVWYENAAHIHASRPVECASDSETHVLTAPATTMAPYMFLSTPWLDTVGSQAGAVLQSSGAYLVDVSCVEPPVLGIPVFAGVSIGTSLKCKTQSMTGTFLSVSNYAPILDSTDNPEPPSLLHVKCAWPQKGATEAELINLQCQFRDECAEDSSLSGCK